MKKTRRKITRENVHLGSPYTEVNFWCLVVGVLSLIAPIIQVALALR